MKKIFSFLAAAIVAVSAWGQSNPTVKEIPLSYNASLEDDEDIPYEEILTATDGYLTFEGETYTGKQFTIISKGYSDEEGINLYDSVTIFSLHGEIISKVEGVISFDDVEHCTLVASAGTISGTIAKGETLTISDINQTSVTISSTTETGYALQVKIWKIYSKDISTGIESVKVVQTPSTKVIHDGQVLILKGDKVYNLLGTEVSR